MKFAFIALLFLSLTATAQKSLDVVHYNFNIELDETDDSLKAVALIKFLMTQPSDTISFDLAGIDPKTSKGMVVGHVALLNPIAKSVNFIQQDNKLFIIPQHQFAPRLDTIELAIRYSGIPSDGLIISKNKYGDKTFFADNWPNRAHFWIPCNDQPADKASFEFLVTAPGDYQVVSNGVFMAERLFNDGKKKLTRWMETTPLSTKVMVIGVAKFAVKTYEDSPAGIPVSAWTYKQDSANGFKNYSLAPAIVKFFSDYIGPFPYKKLANVQSKTIFGGMENAGAIFYYEESANSKSSVEDLLAHEIVHQWFGDMASEKSFPHLWLSEGFATYLTDMYNEAKYGIEKMNQKLKGERSTVINFAKKSGLPVVDTVSSLMSLLNANSYQKGGWILHMIRHKVGNDVFKNFVRTYYNKYKGSNADTEDIRAVLEQVTKKSWKDFFQQWLYTGGIPVLTIQWKYEDGKVLVTVNQTQKQGAFQFPLQLKLNSKIETINITKASETFTIPVKEKIEKVEADPNVVLLFDGKVEAN